jgi:hypothetical protein
MVIRWNLWVKVLQMSLSATMSFPCTQRVGSTLSVLLVCLTSARVS